MSRKQDDLYYVEDTPVPDPPKEGQEPAPWDKTRIIGNERPRVDAYERVSGTAEYPSDIRLPNMLYGAILRCPHAHARVQSVDTSKAEKMDGVHAVISNNSPVADIEWPYSDDFKPRLFDPHCLYEGETVAAVAAETPYQAWDAAHAIEVKYEVLDFVSDERKALESRAPKVHSGGNERKTETHSRGDVEKGFQEADVVLEKTYRTACELHTPIERHGCVANWEGDRLTIWESTQGVYAVQSKVAEVLKMPLSRVRVIGHYMGGGFGSKLRASKYNIIAALLAKQTARPVKLFLTREETFLVMGNRPPANMTLKIGARKDGALTALRFSCTATGGAYPAGGTSLLDWLIRDLYTCPNVQTKATDVYINAGLARPFRAPGHPQGNWALEQMMDDLAEALDMDPVELRLKNIPDHSQAREGNPPFTTNGLPDCLNKGSEAYEWKKHFKPRAQKSGDSGHIRRGVGMACSSWFVGGGWPPSTVILKLFSDGSLNLNMGASDIGTGTKSVMAFVAAEELGVNPDTIQIENADTGTTQYASPSGGSKTVPTEAPTVRAAAIDLKRQLLKMAAKDLEAEAGELDIIGEEVVSEKDASKKIKMTDISELKSQKVIVGIGKRGPNPEDKAIVPFGAQFCEVEVDTRTGEVKILNFLGAHDSGRVMHRKGYDSQVIGGIAMGIGLATTEFRVLDANQTGKLCNRNWHDYKLPTALDVPAEITSVPIEMPDEEANSTGAKGLGEPVTIPTAAAVANAVYNATGVRITESPINPIRLVQKLAEQRKEE
jgi:CO/xanthine dehydrogenase Mo-binding subunit